jgi:SNF2 family DNA or RNA helicase
MTQVGSRMTTITSWAPYFQSAIRAKGRAYQREGRVKLQPPQKGEVGRALVKGSQAYTVIVMGHQAGSTVQCTCPVFRSGVYCKHIWATLLELGQSAYGQAKIPTTSSDQPDQADTSAAAQSTSTEPQSDDDGGTNRMPKAKKKDGSAPTQRHSEPAWSSRLSLLRPNDPEPSTDAGINLAQKQLCYCVSTEQSAMHGALVVCLRQRESTSAGWTRPRRYRISSRQTPRLPDPIDRELCAALLGAEPVVYNDLDSSEAIKTPEADTFIIYAGWRTLLKKICDTGRAFLERETGDPTPLTWEQAIPWRLWASGLEDREGINLKLELRRNDQRMGIDDPDLVLGGPDGILISEHIGTPFDDHGATRWVSLFRDDARYGRKRGDFIVPFDDVPRFVERLFSMPNLPEIDLPEEHCPAVEKPEPVPHVEINGASQDSGTLVDAPKGQLVARVEFLYADASVAPSSPGAFIIQKEPAQRAREAKLLAAQEAILDEDSGVQPGVDGDLAAGLDDSGVELELDPENPSPINLVGHKIIRRSPLTEQSHLAFLVNQGFRPHPVHAPDALLLPAKQLHVATEKLLAQGWKVSVDKKVLRKASPPRLTVSSGVDWFDIQAMIDFDTGHGIQRVPFPELLAAIKKGSRFITLKDGSQGLLPQQFIDQYHALAGLGQTHDDKIRFASSQAVLLEAMLKDQTDLQTDEGFEQARQRLSQFAGIQPLEPTPGLKGNLRPYQREGLGWLYFLRWLGMGGILADDMGLGKTIQILALLDRVYSEKQEKHCPTLVIVPRSVVFNWIDEAQHFAPGLRVQAYTGTDRKTLLEAFDQHDIIVTTYGLVRRDINALSACEFEYVVLDEAQAIKNPSSQSAKAVRLLKSRHRLALTGTPIENHLGDIWSIFEFLNPGMLGSQTGFGRLIRGEEGPGAKSRPTVSLASPDMADDQAEELEPAAIAETDAAGNPTPAVPGPGPQGEAPLEPMDQGTIVNVTRAIRPFVMRRTKQQVLVDLPEKTEQTIYCEMEPEQQRLYDQLRKHYQTALLGEAPAPGSVPAIPGEPGAKPAQPAGTMMVLEALLRLRQAACHPGLIDQARSEEKAAKLETLMERLSVLIEQGVKTLVFSQFTSMLALVKQRLDKHGIVYEYLDGQTRNRKERVQRFQSDPLCPVFLISLKAGGLGLNLTAAEYVFILDPWWNPAVEAQAIDRAHRIGQNRKVFAYRLICQDTVEQRIAELQQHKRKLADAIVGGEENLLKSLTREDLEKLLS